MEVPIIMKKPDFSEWSESVTIHDIVYMPAAQLTEKTGMNLNQILDLRMAIAASTGLEIVDCPCCDSVLDFNYCKESFQNSDVVECPFCCARLGKEVFFGDIQ